MPRDGSQSPVCLLSGNVMFVSCLDAASQFNRIAVLIFCLSSLDSNSSLNFLQICSAKMHFISDVMPFELLSLG